VLWSTDAELPATTKIPPPNREAWFSERALRLTVAGPFVYRPPPDRALFPDSLVSERNIELVLYTLPP
jgi:hypothetical protein